MTLLLFGHDLLAKEYSYQLHVTKVDSKGWEIEYTFNSPVTEVSFETNPRSMRNRYWDILPRNSSFVDDKAGGQSLKLDKSSDKIKIRIKDDGRHFYKREYTPFLNFSDESAAIYLGHYILSQIVSVDGTKEVKPKVIATLYNKIGDSILFGSKSVKKKLKIGSLAPSTYAYFGDLKVKKLSNLNLLIDPELPSWISEAYKKYLPMVMRHYEKSTGINLGFKPNVFISYDPHNKRTSFDGGVVGNQLLINFKGSGWQHGREDNYVNVLKLLFHEGAHLWNGTLFKNKDIAKKIWLHEGMAEYFAIRALYDLGIIAKEEYKKLNVSTIEDCSLGLTSKSVNKMYISSSMTRIYNCGSSLFFIGERIMGDTVYAIWGDMLDNKARLYSEESFLKLPWPDEVQSSFKDVLNGGNKSTVDAYIKLLSDANINLSPKHSQKYLTMLRGNIIEHLMKVSCSRVGYWSYEDYYKTEGIAGCGFFEKERRIIGVGSYNLFENTVQAYGYLEKGCLRNKQINVNLYSGNSATVKCSQDVDALPTSISPIIH